MIRTYLLNKNELEQIRYSEDLFSTRRREQIGKLKREDDKALSACAELLLICGLRRWQQECRGLQKTGEQPQAAGEEEAWAANLPLNITQDERGKLQLTDIPLYFNLSHAGDYAACAIADAPVGVDIEYFRVKELLHPDRILHPEEALLLAYISNPNEKKKYFYECWVAKESYLKNLGIGLIVRPRDFLVSEDTLKIGDKDYAELKGHHALTAGTVESSTKDNTLQENLSYLEKRYVHVLEPGEVRGADWKFDAGYRMAVCSLQKDADSITRLLHAADINSSVNIGL